MRHAISSLFKGARSAGNLTAVAVQDAALHAGSSSMTVLRLDQLRHIAGGDGATVDGLPKGGWNTTAASA